MSGMATDPGLAAKRIAKPKKPAEAGLTKAFLRDVPNSRLYVELKELDLRIEQYSNRKKAEICDMNQPMDLRTRCLRLYFYNQHFHQGSKDPNKPPSWSFYIYGHFVEHNQAITKLPQAPAPAAPFTPQPLQEGPKKGIDKYWTGSMSSIHVSITYPNEPERPDEVVTWQRNRHVGQHRESIEIHRLGSKAAHITVTMARDFAPERVRVTGALASALSLSAATRGHILRTLWRYVLEHSTAEAADPAFVTPDATLRQLFDVSRLELASLGRRVEPFISPPEPVVLRYTVQLDGVSPSAPLCYDVEVAWALKANMLQMPTFLERLDVRQAVEAKDKKVADCLQALKLSHRKYNFFMGFAADPVQFIHRLVAASAREIREAPHGGQVEMPSSEHFRLPWAQEAAVQYLQRRETPGTAT